MTDENEPDKTTTEENDSVLYSTATAALEIVTADETTQIEPCMDRAISVNTDDEQADSQPDLEQGLTASASADVTTLWSMNEVEDPELEVVALKSGEIDLWGKAGNDEDKYILALSAAIRNAVSVNNDCIRTLGVAERQASYLENTEPDHEKNAFGADKELKETSKTNAEREEQDVKSDFAVTVVEIQEGETLAQDAIVDSKSHTNINMKMYVKIGKEMK